MKKHTATLAKYKNYEYVVFHTPMGTWCGYVKLPENHPYFELTKKKTWVNLEAMTWKMKKDSAKREGIEFDIPKPKGKRRYLRTGYNDMDIEVHGGLTFSNYVKNPKDWDQGFTKGAWIGWDYAHMGDYIPLPKIDGMPSILSEGKKYVASDIKKDCKDVINQLISKEKTK